MSAGGNKFYIKEENGKVIQIRSLIQFKSITKYLIEDMDGNHYYTNAFDFYNVAQGLKMIRVQ